MKRLSNFLANLITPNADRVRERQLKEARWLHLENAAAAEFYTSQAKMYEERIQRLQGATPTASVGITQ